MVLARNSYVIEYSILFLLLLFSFPVLSFNSSELESIKLKTFAAKDETAEGMYITEGCLNRDNVDLDKDIDKVCDRLKSLDIILTKMCKDPPVAGGEEMMKLVRTYNQACLDLLYLCSMDKLRVLNASQDILERGGPKFFDITVDDKKLEERFQWDEDKMDELCEVRRKTYEHWNDLWSINNNFP